MHTCEVTQSCYEAVGCTAPTPQLGPVQGCFPLTSHLDSVILLAILLKHLNYTVISGKLSSCPYCAAETHDCFPHVCPSP